MEPSIGTSLNTNTKTPRWELSNFCIPNGVFWLFTGEIFLSFQFVPHLIKSLTSNYEQEQSELIQAVAELEQRLANAEQDNIDLRAFLSIIRKCTDLKELTPELVNRLITKIEIFDSTKDENGKKHVPIKVHFIGVGILEIPDTQTIIAAKEEIRKNPPSAA